MAGVLATVSCPYGGSITVAWSIAGTVQALLDDPGSPKLTGALNVRRGAIVHPTVAEALA